MFKRKESTPREVICLICGKIFSATHSQAKYCPGECRQESHREMWRRYTASHKEARAKHSHDQRAQNPEYYAAKNKAYQQTVNGKLTAKRSDIKVRNKYPEKCYARKIVSGAKRKGILVPKPCQVCENPKVEAHHKDYSKPLEILWLCKKHHMQFDKEIKTMEEN
jgi:hypothetical protein